MEAFYEFSKEVLKGIVRAISAHLFRKIFLEKEKTTRRAVRSEVALIRNILL